MSSLGAAASIVSALARMNQKFGNLAVSLRKQNCVQLVRTGIIPCRYDTGDRVECYVDAELASGNAVGWWLEFRCETGSWIIESSVRLNTEAGQDELVGLPIRYAVEDSELIEELDGAANMLIATTDRLDLAEL